MHIFCVKLTSIKIELSHMHLTLFHWHIPLTYTQITSQYYINPLYISCLAVCCIYYANTFWCHKFSFLVEFNIFLQLAVTFLQCVVWWIILLFWNVSRAVTNMHFSFVTRIFTFIVLLSDYLQRFNENGFIASGAEVNKCDALVL